MGTLDQLLPPFVVLHTVPAEPHAQTTVALTAFTLKSAVDDPVGVWVIQV